MSEQEKKENKLMNFVTEFSELLNKHSATSRNILYSMIEEMILTDRIATIGEALLRERDNAKTDSVKPA